MATLGFPWLGQTQEQEQTILSEKIQDDNRTNGVQKGKLADATNHRTPTTNSEKQSSMRQNTTSTSRPRPSPSVKSTGPSRSALSARSVTDPGPVKPQHQFLQVRTIPPWVRSVEEEDLDDPELIGLDSPDVAVVARHHHSLSGTQRPLLSGPQTNQARVYPTSSGEYRSERTSRWISFARASAYPRENFHHEKVTPEWLDENMTDYSRPWLEGREDVDEDFSNSRAALKKRRTVWYRRAQYTILRNPFIPLVFRLTIFTFALTALGLGATLYFDTGQIISCIAENPRSAYCVSLVGSGYAEFYRGPSSLMAIIVDSVALVYIVYITYDEYFSKPLGLRPARAKVRLMLLDLIFICFQSANLSLSFSYLAVDDGACRVGSDPGTSRKYDQACEKSEALAAVLLVSLVAWLFTFSVSVLRLVERINKM